MNYYMHAQTFVIRISWNYFQLFSSLSWGVSMKKLNCLADLDFEFLPVKFKKLYLLQYHFLNDTKLEQKSNMENEILSMG